MEVVIVYVLVWVVTHVAEGTHYRMHVKKYEKDGATE
jgi:hypothetical protein